MTHTALLDLHVKSLFTLDENENLLTINEPWNQSQPAPSLYVGTTCDGFQKFFVRAKTDALLRSKMETLFSQKAEPEHYVELLGGGEISKEICYCFAEKIPAKESCLLLTPENIAAVNLGEFSWLAEEISFVQPCFVFLHEQTVVSVCRSVRIDRAHEAGIETAADFRGKGYASVVLAAWAKELIHRGNIPLYSTHSTNLSSQRLAEKFGLRLFATGFHIS